MKKYTKKAKTLALFTVLVFSFIPSTSEAGFFDWLGESNRSFTSPGNFPIFQSGSIYAHAGFNQLEAESDTPFTTIFQHNAIIQPTSLRTVAVVKKTPVKTTASGTASKVMTVRASAYSSTPDQTDASPFITAKGTRVRDGIIAANFLPFNTLVKIPDLYGDKVFVVEDRMNARYTNTIDIWFPDRQSALNFGRQTVRIEIAGRL